MKLKNLRHDSCEYITSDDKPSAIRAPLEDARGAEEEGEATEEDLSN